MTEKRFKYTFEGIEDTLESDEEYKYTPCSKDGFQDLCVMLNELNEENEQLKKQLKCSREEADDYCEELMGKDEFVRLYKRQRDDTLKENEQLKSVVKEVLELLSEEVDLFSNKATEHDINAYIELKELDNKDAYYMATATKKAIKLLKEVIDDC